MCGIPGAGKEHLLIVGRSRSTYGASRCWMARSIDGLAPPAQSDRKRGSEWVRLLHDRISLRLVVDHADCGMDQALLHRLGGGGELADRDVEITINHSSGAIHRLRPASRGTDSAREWEAEHRQDAHVREALAQRPLR